jgi:hypothetical protein
MGLQWLGHIFLLVHTQRARSEDRASCGHRARARATSSFNRRMKLDHVTVGSSKLPTCSFLSYVLTLDLAFFASSRIDERRQPCSSQRSRQDRLLPSHRLRCSAITLFRGDVGKHLKSELCVCSVGESNADPFSI